MQRGKAPRSAFNGRSKITLSESVIRSFNVFLCSFQTDPAVDPLNEPNGAQGVVVAEIFAVKAGGVERFTTAALMLNSSTLEAKA